VPRDEVHVWRAGLDMSPETLGHLADTLAEDERARTSRFRFSRDRHHSIAARGILRDILARYLGEDPAAIRFRYGPAGKPALLRDRGAQDLRFNVSHSHGLALYSITCGRHTGVDVERNEPRVAAEPIAERFFSAPEILALQALPEESRGETFFHCWTRKEAYVKARGGGLAIPLDSFDVPLTTGDGGDGAALLRVHHVRPGASAWSVQGLTPGPGYVGAVAAEGCDWRVRLWQWQMPEDFPVRTISARSTIWPAAMRGSGEP
jgi:4'-phosphopantetheinyl transferase